MERVVTIEKSGISDLMDLLRVARAIGKKVLECELVHVSPIVGYYNNHYIVTVTKEQNGKTNVERKKENATPKTQS